MRWLLALPPLQEAAPAQGQDFSFFFMLGAIFLVFYFLVLRPQQTRQRDHEKSLKAIERGDSVISSGGIHGKVTGVTDDVLTVEIGVLKGGERMRVKMQRSRIDSVTKPKDEKAREAEKGKSEKAKGGKS